MSVGNTPPAPVASDLTRPGSVAIFGASGGIGAALASAIAGSGTALVHAGSRSGALPAALLADSAIRPFRFDLLDEASIAAAAAAMADDPLEWVIVATGALVLPSGAQPEKSWRAIEAAAMAEAYAINTIGPALIARHIFPLLPRNRHSVFAVLSARVGSVSDNRLGGWHSYRASKAALNMLVKNWAIELGRSHPQAVVAALHPGTVDTGLSAPFQRGLPDGQLTTADAAAQALLAVMAGLTPAHSGQLLGWDGRVIAP